MKTRLLFFSFFAVIFATKAQLVLLDEPIGEGSGAVFSLAVYDNDILYSMTKDNATFTSGVFLSNGVPGERVDLLPGGSFRAQFNANITGDFVRLYNEGNYVANQSIYAGIFRQGSLNKVYKLNKTRSLLIPDNIFKPTTNNFNIQKVANGGLVTIDTIQENGIDKLVLRHIKDDGNQDNFTLPDAFLGENLPGLFVKWNDKLIFNASVLGESDLYEVDALGVRRVTQNKVSKPTAFKGVTPKSLLLDDFIYFIGRDGFYTNVVPGPAERNYPVRVCYTNGDIDFGSTETAINNGDDGSLGYKSFNETDSPDNILGKINNKVIYFKEDGFSKKFYSVPNLEDLEIDAPQTNVFQYIQHEEKLYVFPKVGFGFHEDLFISNGTKAGTRKISIPRYIATSTPAKNIGKVVPVGNRLYFLAEYEVSETKHLLLAYNTDDDRIELIFKFPNNVKPNVNYLYSYNNGFIIRSKETLNSEEKIYTVNAEIRSKIFDNSQSKSTKNSTKFTYDTVEYNVDANTTTFNETDKLKVQLLDTLSIQFKSSITKLPDNEDKNKISKLFYGVSTLKENNTFSSTLSLGFDDDMFKGADVTGDKLTLLAYYNNSWTELNAQSFDNTNKTLTINLMNLPSEAYIFFKFNGTLSVENSELTETLVNIYPNPATSNINIKASSAITQLEMYNILGKKVLSKKNDTQNLSIDVSNFAKGMYLIKAKTDDYLVTKKIIID